MTDLTRADLRVAIPGFIISRPINDDDELAAILRRDGWVKVTEKCEHCDGAGHLYVDPDEPCPKCGGRGWVLADGVLWSRSFDAQGNVSMMVEFPAEWLEADDA